MKPNIFQPLPVPGTGEIREILVKRVDQQKQAAGMVAGVIDPNGRRVVAYGKLAPRVSMMISPEPDIRATGQKLLQYAADP